MFGWTDRDLQPPTCRLTSKICKYIAFSQSLCGLHFNSCPFQVMYLISDASNTSMILSSDVSHISSSHHAILIRRPWGQVVFPFAYFWSQASSRRTIEELSTEFPFYFCLCSEEQSQTQEYPSPPPKLLHSSLDDLWQMSLADAVIFKCLWNFCNGKMNLNFLVCINLQSLRLSQRLYVKSLIRTRKEWFYMLSASLCLKI